LNIDRIWSSRLWPKFGKNDPSYKSAKSAQAKFGWVVLDQNSSKFDRVNLDDTNFRKFNLNFLYKKYILEFEFGPIWIWILKKFKSIPYKIYLDPKSYLIM